uniref:Uncharacterized protein n=1 Tax=Arundo donax TaxID=35708 RepID=A0A0A9GFT0_ARUDO
MHYADDFVLIRRLPVFQELGCLGE